MNVEKFEEDLKFIIDNNDRHSLSITTPKMLENAKYMLENYYSFLPNPVWVWTGSLDLNSPCVTIVFKHFDDTHKYNEMIFWVGESKTKYSIIGKEFMSPAELKIDSCADIINKFLNEKAEKSIQKDLCNMCGKSCRSIQMQDMYGLIGNVTGGYDSTCLYDECCYQFNICEECLVKIFEQFKIPVKVYDCDAWAGEILKEAKFENKPYKLME